MWTARRLFYSKERAAFGEIKHKLSERARLVASESRRGGVSAERRKCDGNFRWRLSAESRYAEIRMPQGQRVAWRGARGWAMTEIKLGAHSALLAASKQLAAS